MRRRERLDMTQRGYVYRCYDPDGALVYIGSSNNVEVRMGNHRSQAWWYSQVATVETEAWPDLQTARDEELKAIIAERPRCNLHCRPLETTQDYLDRIAAWEHPSATGYSRERAAVLRRRLEAGALPPQPDGDWPEVYAWTLRHIADLLDGDHGLDAVDAMRTLAARALGETDKPIVGKKQAA